MRALLKTWSLALARGVLRRLVRRELVVLPADAARDEGLLRAQGDYRVEHGCVVLEVHPPAAGHLRLRVSPYRGWQPTTPVWESPAVPVSASAVRVEIPLDGRPMRLDGVPQDGPAVPVPLAGRRFVVDLVWRAPTGELRTRRTGHYLPGNPDESGAAYYHGDNYVDHDAQTAAEWPAVVALVQAVATGPRVLDVGCATGGLVQALRGAGFEACGADRSAWAIGEAVARIGPHAFVWDAAMTPPPAPLAARGPFDTIVLWVTLEHFADPWGVLAALTPVCAPNARLIVKTTNADSLTHRLFGRQWEGHFDATHAGVEAVGVASLRATLPTLGWRIVSLDTDRIWDSNADPTHATLREWWAADARFRALLAEHDLGDLITLVAERA